jgi:hypothetical protein
MRFDPALSLEERLVTGLRTYTDLIDIKSQLEENGSAGREQYQRRLEAINQYLVDTLLEIYPRDAS